MFASISRRFGLRGQYGPTFGIATDNGREDAASSADMASSSSASHSSVEVVLSDDLVEEVVEDEVVKCDDGFFLTTITFRKKLFRLVASGEVLQEGRPAVRHEPCRKGGCVDASLDRETPRLTRVFGVPGRGGLAVFVALGCALVLLLLLYGGGSKFGCDTAHTGWMQVRRRQAAVVVEYGCMSRRL